MIFKRRSRSKNFENKFSVQLSDQKTRYRWWQRLLFWLLIILIVLGFWYIFISGNFTVDNIVVEGLKSIPAEDVERKINLKGRNILFIRSDEVKQELNQIFEIKNIALVRVLPKTVRLIIMEREPVLVWQTTNKQYMVDTLGIPFKEVTDIGEGLYKVVDTANIHVNVGEQLAPRSFINAYLTLAPNIREIYQDQLDRFEIGETVYDLDAVMKDGRRVRLNVLSNVSNQLAELKRISTDRPDLFARGVIDLRVDRWAYIQ